MSDRDPADQAEAQAALDAVRQARAALRPFARAARVAEDDEPSTHSLAYSSARHELTIGHLFKARAALESLDARRKALEGK